MLSKLNILLCSLLLGGSFILNAQQISSAALGKMEARNIGPAVIGGRITDIKGVDKDPRILYVGTAGGGIWKTTNGGTLFTPIFDKHCQSIGALAINQKNPDEIWAGTGESNMRNSVSIGNGIYKSIDGGDNWVKMGLENSEHISKIIIHPDDPNTVYVAVPGKLWSDSPDRGLYKTSDGGKTWTKILYVNERSGCADIALDPKNPNIVYATTWELRRKPFSFESGGKGSGIYKSIDAGKSWNKIQNGIPAGDIGRVAIAVSPVKPDRLVAIVESKKTGLYLSDDAGANWKAQSADDNVTARPFYFSTLQFDLTDPDRVYRPAYEFSFSNDGGYSWNRAQNSSGWVHVDMHALWINPNNNSHMYLGTDGGVYMSVDRGNNWFYLNNMPIAQAYHVQIDQQDPYHVYAGFQDNGSWTAASQSIGGIENGDWANVGGGDGFWVQPDRENNQIVYSEYQGGHVQRIDRRSNQGQDIQPKAQSADEKDKLRFNWNTPIQVSPNNPKRIYMGAQFLFTSLDKGLSWQKISPDLTTNDTLKTQQGKSGGVTVDNTSAENHCTIFSIAESPLDENMIWVGTDDGNLQLSLDGGKSWKNIAANYAAAGIPKQTWVSSIEPSRFDKNVVYATFDNHMYGDMKTYIGRSADMGKTWTMFNSPSFKGFAHIIREDIKDKDLLFAGTEWGLYMSLDAGKNWVQMKGRVPEYVSVRDLQIDPRSNDLVIGTHGRSILVVDDISPLRELNDAIIASDVALLPSKPTAVSTGHYGQGWPTAGSFIGPNSSEDAQISYYLKNRQSNGDVMVSIYNDKGQLMAEIPGSKRKGINRIYWNMRSFPPRVAEGGAQTDWASTVGPLVLPGNYTVEVKAGDFAPVRGNLTLTEDPKSLISKEDRMLNYSSVRKVMDLHSRLADLMLIVLQQRDFALSKGNIDDPLALTASAYFVALEKLRSKMVATTEGTAITGEEKLRDHISDLYWGMNFYEGRPSQSQLDKVISLEKDVDAVEAELNEAVNTYLKTLNPSIRFNTAKDLLQPR